MSPRRSVATFFMAAMSALFMTAQSQAQAPDLGKSMNVSYLHSLLHNLKFECRNESLGLQ